MSSKNVLLGKFVGSERIIEYIYMPLDCVALK